MKYVTTERFIVSSNNPEAAKKYKDNYDAVFRKDTDDASEVTSELIDEVVGPDGIECHIREYVYECQVCKCLHTDPAGHEHHGVFRLDND